MSDVRVVFSVLSSKQFARRWRDCNPGSTDDFMPAEEDDEWRTCTLKLLSAAHTLGGVIDLSFDVVDSRYADFAFELGSDSFKWRWETCTLGPKVSAEILSKHLIMPLISVTHLSFSSADPVSEISEADLEKAVDKIGRTARRTMDTHVKHAISRPRVATTLRRMTAMFNFSPDLPVITSNADTPEFSLPSVPRESRVQSAPLLSTSPGPAGLQVGLSPKSTAKLPSSRSAVVDQAAEDDSVTERSDDEALPPPASKSQEKGEDVLLSSTTRSDNLTRSGSLTRANPILSRKHTSEDAGTPNRTSTQAPTTGDTSPSPPAKRSKPVTSSSDEDSEGERKRQVALIKSSAHRGAKQPLKRGGRRF
ncbi:hypothetical protein AcW1_008260 [Taiwanofungus camphoratus]|nr:hypothetical protein AcV5_008557 [Antrodia cinnamomea]KAI0951147.1 hypothetical protein AcW1_008260 [Antrodia cinnamomea]KAI0956035.1 hypothetical protein AcV7_006545 [Antrodia cinnamomea]